jgi:hypothetical protein
MCSGKVRRLMAGIAAHGGNAVAVFAALYVLKMHVTIIALQRRIARGVTILASRRNQYAINLHERSLGRRRIRLRGASCSRSAQREHSGGESNSRQDQDYCTFNQKAA